MAPAPALCDNKHLFFSQRPAHQPPLTAPLIQKFSSGRHILTIHSSQTSAVNTTYANTATPQQTTESAMSDSHASAAPRKRAKLSDQSPTGHKKAQVHASEDVSFGAAQKTLDHEEKLVGT
jgi:hypothetical protein